MLNHTRFRNGIQIEPSYSTDPAIGLVGDVYLNSVTKKLRICTQGSPTVLWGDVSLGSGSSDNAPLVWSNFQNAWIENSELSLESNTISSNNSDLILQGSIVNEGSVLISGKTLKTNIGQASDPLTGNIEEIYYNTTTNKYRYYDGIEWKSLGDSATGGGFYKVAAVDVLDTVLPTTPSPTIDSYVIQEDDEVLFVNLATGNNIIYKATNVTATINWTPVTAFAGSLYAINGDGIIVQHGTHATQIGIYTGASWAFSEKRRQFAGLNYFEESAIYSTPILNNNNAEVFSIAKIGSEYLIIDYSISRGIGQEVGQIFMVHDGSNAIVTGSNGELAPTGVAFSAGISGLNLILYYMADNNGSDGEIKFSIKRWSNATGGPAGVPSYTASPTTTNASGTVGSIQFSNGSTLASSSNFKINNVDNALEIGTMQILPLIGPVSLSDDTPLTTTIFQFPKVWEFVEIDYSAERDTNRRRGRFFIVNNGVSANIYESYVELAPMNLMFTTSISASNVNVEFISMPNGFNSTFKYTVTRWQ